MLSLIAARASWRLLGRGTRPLRAIGALPAAGALRALDAMRAMRVLARRGRGDAHGRPHERAVLAASRRVFRDMQKAWDRHDLLTLQALTLEPVFDDLRQTLDAVDRPPDAPAGRTAILALDARLLGVDPVGDGIWLASVEFSGRTRERRGAAPEPFRELWMFSGQCAPGRRSLDWRLARVQPLY